MNTRNNSDIENIASDPGYLNSNRLDFQQDKSTKNTLRKVIDTEENL